MTSLINIDVQLTILSFVRSGWIGIHVGQAWYIGHAGYGWPRVLENATSAYYLHVNPTDVNPSDKAPRWYGYPLRCLYYGSV